MANGEFNFAKLAGGLTETAAPDPKTQTAAPSFNFAELATGLEPAEPEVPAAPPAPAAPEFDFAELAKALPAEPEARAPSPQAASLRRRMAREAGLGIEPTEPPAVAPTTRDEKTLELARIVGAGPAAPLVRKGAEAVGRVARRLAGVEGAPPEVEQIDPGTRAGVGALKAGTQAIAGFIENTPLLPLAPKKLKKAIRDLADRIAEPSERIERAQQAEIIDLLASGQNLDAITAQASKTFGDVVGNLAVMKATFGAVGKLTGIKSLVGSGGKAQLIRAAQFAAINWAKTRGTPQERSRAALLGFLYMSTPGVSGLAPNNASAIISDLALNSLISATVSGEEGAAGGFLPKPKLGGQHKEAIRRGIAKAKADGNDQAAFWYAAAELLPVVGTDVAFSMLTRSAQAMKDAEIRRTDGTVIGYDKDKFEASLKAPPKKQPADIGDVRAIEGESEAARQLVARRAEAAKEEAPAFRKAAVPEGGEFVPELVRPPAEEIPPAEIVTRAIREQAQRSILDTAGEIGREAGTAELSARTKAELQEEARARGLSATGNKDELVTRIQEQQAAPSAASELRGLATMPTGDFSEGGQLRPSQVEGLEKVARGVEPTVEAEGVPLAPATAPERTKADTRAGFVVGPGPSFLRKWFTAPGNLPREVFRALETSKSGVRVRNQEAADLSNSLKREMRRVFGFRPSAEQVALVDAALKGGRSLPLDPGSRALQAGERIVAKDRGNIGTITKIDGDNVTVFFKNRHTGGRATKTFTSDQIKRRFRSQLTDAVDAGVTINNLPENLREPVAQMRDYTDSLSREIIASGAVSEDMKTVLGKNLGHYLTRSYRIFDDPKWAKNLMAKRPDIVNRAKAFLASEHPELSEAQIKGRVEEILYNTADNPLAFVRDGKIGSKNLGILMARKNVDPTIRELLGEYKDPNVNFLRSVARMGSLLENQKFLEGVRRDGLGRFLFETPQEGASVRLAAEGSKALEPLNGLFTTPEIADAFRTIQRAPSSSKLIRALVRSSGIVKAAKTIGSAITHVRNFVANPILQVSQGYWKLGKLSNSFKALGSRIGIGGKDFKAKWREKYNEYLRLGVVGEDTRAGEMLEAMRDAGIRDLNLDDMSVIPVNAGIRAVRLANKSIAKGGKALATLYRWEDDFYKIFAFENEMERHRSAFPELPEAQLKERAADIVRQTQPTYSRTSAAVNAIKKNPFIGSFVSFPAEIVRTQFNTLGQGVKELGNPRTRSIGAQRLVGLLTAYGISIGLPVAARAISGVKKDEEEDLRRFVPPWSENSQLLIIGREDGRPVFKYVDTGFSNPLNQMQNPILAAMRGDDPIDSAIGFAKEFFEPFLSEDILVGKLLDVTRNKTRQGKRVYNPEAAIGDITVDMMKHVGQAVTPGTLSSLDRIHKGLTGKETITGRKFDPATEMSALMTGQRISDLDITEAFGFRMRGTAARIRDAKRIFSDVANRRGTVTDQELIDAYSEYAVSRREVMEDAVRDVGAAQRLGVTKKAIRKAISIPTMPSEVRRAIKKGDVESAPITIGDKAKAIDGRKNQIKTIFGKLVKGRR